MFGGVPRGLVWECMRHLTHMSSLSQGKKCVYCSDFQMRLCSSCTVKLSQLSQQSDSAHRIVPMDTKSWHRRHMSSQTSESRECLFSYAAAAACDRLLIPEIDEVGSDYCGHMFFVPFFHCCIRCARLLLLHALATCFPQLTGNGQPPAGQHEHWPWAVLPTKLATMLARQALARPRAPCTQALRQNGPLFPRRRYVLAPR